MSDGRRRDDAETSRGERERPVRLKDVADDLGLSTSTVSLVLNRSPVADSIPQETHERVFEAVERLGYRPNLLARSLRNRKTDTVGVVVPEMSGGYAAEIMHGVESRLRESSYLYLLASHRSSPEVLRNYLRLLQDRNVEGFILLAARLEKAPALPTVVVSGHDELAGVTNVIVDEVAAARLALEHLTELGHEKIAFFRGPPSNVDTAFRWGAIERVAGELGIEISRDRVVDTEGISYGEVFYQQGYAHAQELLRSGRQFTALYAFNDISAIGAIRGLLDAGIRVPEDVSVVGFDDIQSASFLNPSLTTVRQPLEEMGRVAGETLLDALAGRELRPSVVVEPELIPRASTGPVGDR